MSTIEGFHSISFTGNSAYLPGVPDSGGRGFLSWGIQFPLEPSHLQGVWSGGVAKVHCIHSCCDSVGEHTHLLPEVVEHPGVPGAPLTLPLLSPLLLTPPHAPLHPRTLPLLHPATPTAAGRLTNYRGRSTATDRPYTTLFKSYFTAL